MEENLCDPDAYVGYDYGMNQHGYATQDEPREKALHTPCRKCTSQMLMGTKRR